MLRRGIKPAVYGGIFLVMAIAILGLTSSVRSDMTIRVQDNKRHDRFYAGDDKAFIGENFDWSGVGKDGNSHWATMVSPSYFLSAAHLSPSGTVTFFEGNSTSGNSFSYTISGGQQIAGTDLWLGKLATPVDAALNYYPILLHDTEATYVGTELFNYGKPSLIGRNVIEGFSDFTEGSTGRVMIYDFDDNDVIDVGGDETFLEGGDSGGPSFTVWNGRLALLGIHWYHDKDPAWESGDTFVPAYIDDINAAMAGESLTVVPEPTTLALWVVGLIGGFIAWRRRKN